MNAIMRDEHAASNNVLVTTTSHSGANVMGTRHSITLLCQHCGTPFQTNEPRKVTCSRPCMSARIAAGGVKRRGEKSGSYRHGGNVGYKHTPEHNSWRAMRRRCGNPADSRYARYDARGITVCAEWNNPTEGFAAFLAYMGLKPSPKHSIDRYPDYDGNYEPRNVRWATPSEQIRNRAPAKTPTHCRREHPRIPENRAPNGKVDCCRPCRRMKGPRL